MHRLLADTSEILKERPSLSVDAMHHLKVVRPKDGERIELFDGKGRKRLFAYEANSRLLMAAGDVEILPQTEGRIVLFACVTKGSRWDWTIEKATELGVDSIVPVISERTIVRIPECDRIVKRDRWRRVAEDAARQSDAVWLPEIYAPVDFAEALAMAKRTNCFVGALVNPPARPMLVALESMTNFSETTRRDMSIFIGPEGDFSPTELAALLEFATPVSLGPTILRAETAAVFALSLLAAIRNQH